MTIVCLLVFNTLFLLVLVKVLHHNNELQHNALHLKPPDESPLGTMIEAHPKLSNEVQSPSIEQLDLVNETQCTIPDDAQEVQEMHLTEPVIVIKESSHVDKSKEVGNEKLNSKHLNGDVDGFSG